MKFQNGAWEALKKKKTQQHYICIVAEIMANMSYSQTTGFDEIWWPHPTDKDKK